ncbi:hypothetical protein PPYR_15243 [Photinus pyralis]|uniref:Uncharacterized protein n=1 Tax=Photinus pyralis TaxID=7054 RepID=A0A5N3ZZB7_PHOPY|nr:uncharacterized protein LOC116182182 [Photinus pyralis]XP_031358561.1 uncharacterized protein LOC116182182 [Photinus pyralis]KAB0790389.1 hypothetical protein PPYR_15243 [Photinus pyralis]
MWKTTMKLQAVILFLASTVYAARGSDIKDSADEICMSKLNISEKTFYSWFTEEYFVKNLNDPVIRTYMVCWMFEKGMTDKDGKVNDLKLVDWVRDEVFAFYKVPQPSREDKEKTAKKIVPECIEKVGVREKTNGKEVDLGDCLVRKTKASL